MGRSITPEKIAAIHEMVATGARRCDIMAALRVSERTLRNLGVRTTGRSVLRPGDKRLAMKASAERIERVRELTGMGLSEGRIAETMGISRRQVRRVRDNNNIRALPRSERQPAAQPERKGVMKAKRNPMKSLQTWKPPVATTTLEHAVQELRRKVPVFLEATQKRASSAPPAYSLESVFIVGSKRLTGAEILAATA